MHHVRTIRRLKSFAFHSPFAALTLYSLLPATSTLAATVYWDVTAGAGNGVGGTGTWNSSSIDFSTTATGEDTLTTEAITDDVIFQGTAGFVSLSGTVTANSVTFNTSGYTLGIASAAATTLAGAITLSDHVTLSLSPNLQSISLGSITGGTGSSLVLGAGSGAGAGSTYRINLTANATIAASAPITISTTTPGTFTGFVATGGTNTIAATITNNSVSLTDLGATSGNTLVMSGSISGSAGVLFSAGNSGGAGVVVLNATNTYSGPTLFNAAAAGVVRLGITNALPTSTDLNMGFSKNQGQIFDLSNFDQTVGSLFTTSLTGANTVTGSITNSGTATLAGYNTLTIGGSNNQGAFALVIANGVNQGVAITRTGTGVTTFTATNTYTGPTTVSGGYLFINGANAAGSAGTVNGSGELAGSGIFGGSVSIQSGGVVGAGSTLTSVGTLRTGSETWQNGGAYTWKLDLSTPGSSTAPGAAQAPNATGAFDQLIISGLTISNVFKVNVTGLNLGTSSFDTSKDYSYVIAQTGTSQSTIAAQLSNLQVGAVSNFPSGVNASNFSFATDTSGDVVLNYTTAAPEPTSFLLLSSVIAPLMLSRRRRAGPSLQVCPGPVDL